MNLKNFDIPDENLRSEYDFIVVGAGTSGCVVVYHNYYFYFFKQFI